MIFWDNNKITPQTENNGRRETNGLSSASLSHNSSMASDAQADMEIGSQGLKKRILQTGQSWLTPFPGDEVQGTISTVSFFFHNLCLDGEKT